LRPGAVISETDSYVGLNRSGDGYKYGVYAKASGGANTPVGVAGYIEGIYGAGVLGIADSSLGFGGVFRNHAGSGVGLRVLSNGVDLQAAGSGIIQSTANSYLWISGNSLQKGDSDDTTRFEYDQAGGYEVFSGADLNNKGVVLPVTIAGQLFGQNVTVTGLDLYYGIGGDFANIDRVVMYRQNGVGAGEVILRDLDDLTCGAGEQCVKHWDLVQNNELSDNQGIVYIAFGLAFSDPGSSVHIGGVRLTLEHD
jgi:hypothetical protein